MKKNNILKFVLKRVSSVFFYFLIIFFFSYKVLAWGGRGHHTICDAATYLVENQDLRNFLTSRPHVMGHLCNIPDIHWKNSEFNSEGSPAHYLDVELLPLPLKDIPLDFSKIVQEYTGKKSTDDNQVIKSIPHEFGSLWWRADQMYRESLKYTDTLKSSSNLEKLDAKDENDSSDFNKAVYQFYTSLGLMGHFVGDASQPFHSTSDYDGYKKGHGGIHSYYEDFVLSRLPYDLQSKVVKEAKRLLEAKRKEKFLTEKTVLEKMKAISMVSYLDIDKVLKTDKLIKPSELKEEKGMKIKKTAERESIDKTIKNFEPLIIRHLSRSAALLAKIWDQAYLEAGKPKLSLYRSFKYPLTPDFVMPDYYQIQKEKK